VTSRYHGIKISGSQLSFLTERAFVLLKNGRKVCVTVLFLRTIIYRIVLHANFFVFFCVACHICRTTVFLDPELLLPWQKVEINLCSQGNFQSSLLSGCL